MTQQLVLEPLGLMTEPNELGHIPAGAMSQATGIALRSPGVIEGTRAWLTRATVATDAGTTACFLITPPGQRMLVIFNRTAGWFYQWFNQSTGASLFGGATALTFTLGGFAQPQSVDVTRQPGFSYVIHGRQLLVNLYSCIAVFDDFDPATAPASVPRPAGLFPPQIYEIVSLTPGTALGSRRYANYVAIWKRQVGDKLLVSAPSAAMSPWQDVGDSNVRIEVKLSELVKEGDLLEIYRTPSKPTGFDGTYYNFPKGEEAGPEYRKATSVTIDSADITAGFKQVTDRTPDTSLGEALYTTQAVNGEGAAAYPPPAVRFMTSFKGHVFGFSTTTPPSIKLRPTGAWAGEFADTTQAQSGFGNKLLTGCTWSNGGATVTVSPNTQLGFLKLGMQVFATGLNGYITAIGGSTFTFSPAATGAGAATSVSASDVVEIEGGGNFSSLWRSFPVNVANNDRLMLIAPTLKLPPVTSAVEVVTQPVDGFTVRRKLLTDSRDTFGVRSSGPNNWDPHIALITSTFPGTPTLATIENRPRAVAWSDQNQPESWPFVNDDFFSRGDPCAVVATRDSILAFYTDAVWRGSGTGGTARNGFDWRWDPILTNVTIQGSQAICSLGDDVFAMTSEGLMKFTNGSSVEYITRGRVHDQLQCPPWTDGEYTVSTACFLIADEEHNEVLMYEPSEATNLVWLYNVTTDKLTKLQAHEFPFHGDYSRSRRNPMIVGRDGASTWTVKVPEGSYADFVYDYATVYATNPFAQREWQTVDIAVQNPASGGYFVTCNGFACSVGFVLSVQTSSSDSVYRLGLDVPRNAPAIGNVMKISVMADVSGASTAPSKILGVALNYEDLTEQRRNR